MDIDKVIKNLNARGYEVVYIENKEDTLNEIVKRINKDEVVAFGGSKTLDELNIVEYMLNNFKTLNRYKHGLSEDEIYEIERKSLLSDVFITSTNAIALTGELVNIDGKSNRVAAQIFGPKKVFIVSGINKICKTLDEAMVRAQEYAAPTNAKRFEEHFTTGCMKDGICVKCSGPTTICRTVVVTRRAQRLDRTTIFLINDKLGF